MYTLALIIVSALNSVTVGLVHQFPTRQTCEAALEMVQAVQIQQGVGAVAVYVQGSCFNPQELEKFTQSVKELIDKEMANGIEKKAGET